MSRPHRVSVEDFEVAAAGQRLAARWLRPQDGRAGRPPIVFLHEGLGCTAMWRDFPARLVEETGAPALLYDRQGHGGSGAVTEPRPEDWMHREALDVLPGVLGACGVSRPNLFGHSDGGTIGLLYAAHFETRALITEAAHVFEDDLTANGMAKVKAQWRDGTLGKFLHGFHGDKTDALVRAWLAHWRRKQAAGWTIEDALPRIACPVLALQGERDEYGTMAQLDAIAAGVGGPSQGLLLTDCGHVPHIEKMELVLAESRAFLADLPGMRNGGRPN